MMASSLDGFRKETNIFMESTCVTVVSCIGTISFLFFWFNFGQVAERPVFVGLRLLQVKTAVLTVWENILESLI